MGALTSALFGSMHRKLVFAVLLLFSFGLVVSMMLNIHVTQQILNRETTKRAESVLRSMQQKCQYAVTVIDPETGETYVDRRSVDDIVRHIERDEPDVVQVMIVDGSGRVLSSMDPALRNQRPPDLPFAPGCCRDAAPILAHNPDADTLEVMGPVIVNDYAWGTAFIAFALEPVRREIWRLSLQSL
ncbi:MAG: hypothetical protein EOM22_13995, partial [Gammaproteobacteria bacterium]|nr:hypothetical protein [Gammaproteobacteria bacterium]